MEKLIVVAILSSIFVRGEMYKKGDEVKVNKREAHELVTRGVAEYAESTVEVDVDIDDDNIIAIEDMKKNDLVEYASELGIDVPSKATKEQIIDLINALDDEDEQE